MDRRRFLLASLAGALAGPLAAEAQQLGKLYRIGTLWNRPTPHTEDALRQGSRESGWIEGQDFVFERWKTMISDEVEVFIHQHRGDGQLVGDTTAPLPNGYQLTSS